MFTLVVTFDYIDYYVTIVFCIDLVIYIFFFSFCLPGLFPYE